MGDVCQKLTQVYQVALGDGVDIDERVTSNVSLLFLSTAVSTVTIYEVKLFGTLTFRIFMQRAILQRNELRSKIRDQYPTATSYKFNYEEMLVVFRWIDKVPSITEAVLQAKASTAPLPAELIVQMLGQQFSINTNAE